MKTNVEEIDPIIERFRFAHHTIAMMFAAGMELKEIERRTGFTHRRLILLYNDPTFKELIEHYRRPHVARLEAAVKTSFEEMESIHSASIRQIRETIEESDELGERLPLPQLLKIASDFGDRIGFSKHQIKTTINVDFAAALDRAIERSEKVRDRELKEIEPERPVPRLVRRI